MFRDCHDTLDHLVFQLYDSLEASVLATKLFGSDRSWGSCRRQSLRSSRNRALGCTPCISDSGTTHRLALLPNVPKPPLALEIALLVLAVILLRHHWHEFKLSQRQSELPRALEELLLEFEQFRKANPTPDSTKKKAFLESLMKRFKAILEVGNKKREIVISLMEKSDVDGMLVITFVHPPNAPLDTTLKLAVGNGGAGKAYDKKESIYIPSVRHLVGINIVTNKSEVTYERGPSKERYRSMLCVPVLTKSNIIGVLTYSSVKRSTFFPLDFEIASLAAAFVSIFY
jgi:hypothetical protein